MVTAILQHTPTWVWALLAGLTALGLSQTRARELSLARVTVLPAVVTALSLAGVVSAFGAQPMALVSWVGGVGATLALARPVLRVPGAYWRPDTGVLHVPGSWLPLTAILALFAIKYVAGASQALNPALRADPVFASTCALAYGLFSGLFLARARALRALVGWPAADPARKLSPPRTDA